MISTVAIKIIIINELMIRRSNEVLKRLWENWIQTGIVVAVAVTRKNYGNYSFCSEKKNTTVT